jgi:diacylglycerol O-acyltransferase / wax synthase
MLQLSGLDTAFLNMETNTTFGHVATLMLFDGASFPAGNASELVRAHIAARLHRLPPFYRRLVTVPLDLDRPYWIDDGDVDLEFHVRHLGVPPPGENEQLADLIASIIARHIDRTRPLWELYVIEGLASGDIALLLKQHHASIDGASSMDMFKVLFDQTENPEQDELRHGITTETEPGPWELIVRSNLSLLRHPGRAISLQFRAARTLGRFLTGREELEPGAIEAGWSRWLSGETMEAISAAAVTAPRTPLNGSISAHRRYASMQLQLDDVKRIKNAAGTTLNDIVLVICAGALRRYLLRHDALPEMPLIAMVPVSVRTGNEVEAYSNQVSGMLGELATDEADPVKRLRRISQAMKSAKEIHNAVPASLLQDFSKFASPAVAAQAARTVARWRLADRVAPICNIVISNVPGPRETLYLAGAELKALVPVSAIGDGMALNMTLISYRDRLNFGYVACRERVPDLQDLITDTKEAAEELAQAFA